MATAHDVAAAILARVGPVTTMKLQKLVYYAQAWQLAFHNEPLFSERIEAWPQGPVTRVLHEEHRGRYKVSSWATGDPGDLTAEEMATVRWVIDKYSRFSAEALSRMTHMDTPWRVARGILAENERSTTEISHEAMHNFYGRQRSEPEVAVAQSAANSALEGVELDDDWQQVLRDVANGTVSPAEAIAAEIGRAQGR